MSEASTSSAVPFFKKKSKAANRSSSNTSFRKKRSLSPAEPLDDRQNQGTTYSSTGDGESCSSVVRLAKKELYNPLRQGTAHKRRKQDDGDVDDLDSIDDSASSIAISYRDQSRISRRSNSPTPTSEVLTGDAALAKAGQAPEDDGLYHGQASYQAQLPAGSSKFGPIKGPSASIKTITLVDYQVND